jgi:hypothetical protein
LAARAYIGARSGSVSNDGEKGPWAHPLHQTRVTVTLHESVPQPGIPLDYPQTFRRNTSSVQLGREPDHAKSRNAHLRILSALIGPTCLPVVQAGTSAGEIGVETLKGRVYAHHSGPDRNARSCSAS